MASARSVSSFDHPVHHCGRLRMKPNPLPKLSPQQPMKEREGDMPVVLYELLTVLSFEFLVLGIA